MDNRTLEYALRKGSCACGIVSLVAACTAAGLYGVLVAVTYMLGRPDGDSPLKAVVIVGVLAIVLGAVLAVVFGAIDLRRRGASHHAVIGISIAVVVMALLSVTA
jgi:hypothetical protein